MNRSNFRDSIGLALGALLLCAAAHAQEFRAGFVNTARIFKEVKTVEVAQVKLQQEFSKAEKEIADQGVALKSMAEAFNRDAPTLSAAQKLSRQKQLTDQDRDLQRKRRAFQDDLSARKNELMSQILERANIVVKQIAEVEHLDVVLQEAVYVNARCDITDKVINALNSESDK